jgi:hypothetical protein
MISIYPHEIKHEYDTHWNERGDEWCDGVVTFGNTDQDKLHCLGYVLVQQLKRYDEEFWKVCPRCYDSLVSKTKTFASVRFVIKSVIHKRNPECLCRNHLWRERMQPVATTSATTTATTSTTTTLPPSTTTN